MTQSTETVSQRAREAAADYVMADLRAKGLSDPNARNASLPTRNGTGDGSERLRASTNDAPVERLVEALHDALGEIGPAKRYAEECGLEGGKLPSAVHIKLDMIAAHIRDALAALSSPSGEPAVPEGLYSGAEAAENYLRSVGWSNDDLDYVALSKAVLNASNPTPTDTTDRREAVRGKVKGIINAHVAECLRLQSPLHPGPTADAILSLIAGPPEGFLMVPIEPTEAMIEAAASFGGEGGYNRARGEIAVETWREMIAAATGEV